MLVSESPENIYIFSKILEYKNWKSHKNIVFRIILTILCHIAKFWKLYTHWNAYITLHFLLFFPRAARIPAHSYGCGPDQKIVRYPWCRHNLSRRQGNSSCHIVDTKNIKFRQQRVIRKCYSELHLRSESKAQNEMGFWYDCVNKRGLFSQTITNWYSWSTLFTVIFGMEL